MNKYIVSSFLKPTHSFASHLMQLVDITTIEEEFPNASLEFAKGMSKEGYYVTLTQEVAVFWKGKQK
jgi:hypothetical protein